MGQRQQGLFCIVLYCLFVDRFVFVFVYEWLVFVKIKIVCLSVIERWGCFGKAELVVLAIGTNNILT